MQNKLLLFLCAGIILFACTKKVDNPGVTNATSLHYEEKITKDSYLDIPANSIDQSNFLLVNFYDSCNVKQSSSGSYYGDYSGHSITLRSNQSKLNSEASFSIQYIEICTNSSIPCTVYHSDIKPYKAILGNNGLVDCNATWEIIPVTSFQIDSVSRTVKFTDTQLNCIYFLGRKL